MSVIIFLIVASTVIFYFIKGRLNYWKKLEILYEEPSFPYGNIKGIGKKLHIFEVHQKIYEKFKNSGAKFVGIFYYLQPVILVTDLEFAKNIFTKDSAHFIDKGSYYNEKDNPISAHLFNLDNPKWKSLRTKLTPTFTSGKIKMMFSTVVDVGERFVTKIEEEIQTSESFTLDMRDYASRFTTDVIGSVGFGLEINSIDNPDNEFRAMGLRTFTDPLHSPIISKLIKIFKRQARMLKVRTIKKDIEEFFMRIVRDTMDYREKNSVKRSDFLELLIQLKNHGKLDGENIETGRLTFNEIVAQCFIFFAAGYETSSSTMSYALFELAKNQDIQEKTRSDIKNVLKKFGGKLTYDSVKNMDHLEKVIKETLRKYPPIPDIIRCCNQDYKVKGTKCTIKKGQLVVIPAYAFHHDAEIYPDPEAFDPERFSPEDEAKRSPYAWMSFGHGPRNCIGLRFGFLQTKIGLAMLLNNFKFEFCSRTSDPIQFKKDSLKMLTPSDGIILKVSKI